MISEILLGIGATILYLVLGFCTATLNHFVIKPESDRIPAFIATASVWPVMLPIDLGIGLYRLLFGNRNLDDYLDYLEQVRRNRLLKKQQKYKQISA